MRTEDPESTHAVDRCGGVTVTGWTRSFSFPTTPGAFQTTFAGGYYDGFVTRYDAPVNGTANRSYSTYLGASDDDQPNRVALDGRGNAIVAGFTASTSFPTSPGCLQPGFGGGSRDGFVAKLTVLPIGGQGVARFGAATPACAHPIWQDVDALPLAGSPFAVRAHGGPPITAGAMLVGLPGTGVTMFQYLGLWLGAGGPLIGFPAQTNASGCASTPRSAVDDTASVDRHAVGVPDQRDLPRRRPLGCERGPAALVDR